MVQSRGEGAINDAQSIQEDIQWIKDQLQMPGSVLQKIYASSTPKKDLLLHWGYKLERLHELHIYKWNLSHISTTIKNELKEIGLESALPYVHEVLPYKYKRPYDIAIEEEELLLNEDEPRIEKNSDPKKLNKNLIKLLDRTIKVLTNSKKSLERRKPKPIYIEPHIPRREFIEYSTKWKYAISRLKQVLDGREKVPPTTMHMLIYCLAHATLSDTYAKFILYRKEEAKLTPKQCGKIIKGRVSKMSLLYEPKSSGKAMSMGYSGMICDECGSYRTERKYNSNVDKHRLYCYSCGEWTKLKTEMIKVRGR